MAKVPTSVATGMTVSPANAANMTRKTTTLAGTPTRRAAISRRLATSALAKMTTLCALARNTET
eukprot:320921-Rhodomonas_salina.2